MTTPSKNLLVNRHESVESMLSPIKNLPISKLIPAHLLNCGDFVLLKKSLDARVYALVKEDAHSII
jgi:hypothetical protein